MIALRSAVPADAAPLARFAQDAFVAAFGHFTPAADMNLFFAQSRSESAFHAAIVDPEQRVQLAERDGRLAAYALLAMGQGFADRPEPRPRRPVTLSQLYCAGDATGRGLGAALMDWALGEARAWGADAIQLSVWSGNFGAQRFYERYGFAHVADTHFWVGTQRDEEFVFERAL